MESLGERVSWALWAVSVAAWRPSWPNRAFDKEAMGRGLGEALVLGWGRWASRSPAV